MRCCDLLGNQKQEGPGPVQGTAMQAVSSGENACLATVEGGYQQSA